MTQKARIRDSNLFKVVFIVRHSFCYKRAHRQYYQTHAHPAEYFRCLKGEVSEKLIIIQTIHTRLVISMKTIKTDFTLKTSPH